MSIDLDPKKPRVLVALGGKSSERAVSIETGKNIAIALEKNGYSVGVMDIGTGALMQTPELDNIQKDASKLPAVSNIPLVDIKRHFELVFIAMHGKFGEDGGIQSLLENIDVPYTGSDPLSSALAMDKNHSKIVFKSMDIPVLDWEILTDKDAKTKIKFPVIVKPNAEGSSVGVSICENEADFVVGLKLALKKCDKVMVEPFIKGTEITVPVIERENGDARALPVIEIVPKHRFFDFEGKYDGSTTEIVPAKISPELTKKAQDLAVKSHLALGCRHFSRVDMIVDEKGNIFVLELNTIPGMTSESLYPKSAAADKISFE
ncbi:MAG: D-alanine--D-alanine ligase, partial [Candidatus Berkelbacteria bacterium]